MPDHASPLLTSIETAHWLRLVNGEATPEDAESAVRSVHRLVQQKRLRPLKPGREYVFSVDELKRFVSSETASWGKGR